jgi:hypothetical protein
MLILRSQQFLGLYRDGFPQGIAGRQTAGRVIAHAPCNSTVEAFPLCPRMYVRRNATQRMRR